MRAPQVQKAVAEAVAAKEAEVREQLIGKLKDKVAKAKAEASAAAKKEAAGAVREAEAATEAAEARASEALKAARAEHDAKVQELDAAAQLASVELKAAHAADEKTFKAELEAAAAKLARGRVCQGGFFDGTSSARVVGRPSALFSFNLEQNR